MAARIGGEAFVWDDAAALPAARAALRAAMDATGRAALAAMQARCPVDTGYLLSTLYEEVEDDGSAVVLRIGAEADYAVYVELGTSRMAAQPYIRPAADAEFPQLGARIRAALGGG